MENEKIFYFLLVEFHVSLDVEGQDGIVWPGTARLWHGGLNHCKAWYVKKEKK